MKKTAIFSLSALIFFLLSYQNVLANEPNLIGRWNLNENSNNTAKDTSGNSLNGSTINVDLTNGKYGNAFDFKNNSFIKINNSSLLEPSNLSVEAWVKSPSKPGVFKYILSKGALGDNNASYALYTGSDGGLYFYVSQGNSYILSPGAASDIWDNNWHHVVGTYDGSTVRLYVDNTEIQSGTPTNISIGYDLANNNDLFIGTYNQDNSHNFTGVIDEVRIWNRALTPTEIFQHAKSNSSAIFPYDN